MGGSTEPSSSTASSGHELLGTTGTRTGNPFERGGLRAKAHGESCARSAGLPEYVLGRDVELGLPDRVPALQCTGRCRVRARLPATETGARGLSLLQYASPLAGIPDTDR